MHIPTLLKNLAGHARHRPALYGVIGVVLAALTVLVIAATRSTTQAASYYEVRRSDFMISVVERGTIEAVSEVSIRCDMEGTARIIFIVPEGNYVKKGDLLVELDSSSTQDAVNQQQINVEKAQFGVIQAQQQLEIQKSTVESEIDAAKLQVEFAESDLRKYMEGEMVQLRRNAQIEITNIIENLRLAEERLEWSMKLYEKGYETKSNLDKDHLSVSQSGLKKEQAEKALWMLETYDEPKRQRELEAKLQEARENLARVELQGKRKLDQFAADLDSQTKTLDLNVSKLERDKKQLEAAKIMAPQDGLVVYATPSGGGRGFSSDAMIEEGAVVRNRQELIKLPDVSEMKVQVRIHEAHINHIRPGQSAFVVLDSMPDQRFRGLVSKVAPLPESTSRFMNPNLKVYATEVRITDKLLNVKPGVSARAEIVITNMAGVLTVPIQSVTTRKGQQVAYLASTPPQSVPVSVGMYNSKFIEILSGLKEGDRVLLSLPFEAEDKDLGGNILAAGEAPPVADSNEISGVLLPQPNGSGRAPAAGPSADEDGRGQQIRRGDESGLDGSSGAERLEGEGRRRGGRNPANREEMLRQFDANGDGQLDEVERAAMRERSGGRRGRGTNAPPAATPE